MKTIHKAFFLILLFCLIFSCEEVVEITSDEAEETLIVEGLIVNEQGKSYVKLSETKPYFSKSATRSVGGALVTVATGNGEEIIFSETTDGYYECPADFTGKMGETYTLEVLAEGKALSAASTMPDTTQIYNLNMLHVPDGDPNMEKGYYLFGNISDEQNVENFFRFDIYVNGTRQQRTAGDIAVFDDRYLDDQSNIEGQFGYWGNKKEDPFKMKEGDEVFVRLYAIDLAAYNFLYALSDTPYQGGLFGKNPANVPSNIQGGLGIFQATAYADSEIINVQ